MSETAKANQLDLASNVLGDNVARVSGKSRRLNRLEAADIFSDGTPRRCGVLKRWLNPHPSFADAADTFSHGKSRFSLALRYLSDGL